MAEAGGWIPGGEPASGRMRGKLWLGGAWAGLGGFGLGSGSVDPVGGIFL